MAVIIRKDSKTAVFYSDVPPDLLHVYGRKQLTEPLGEVSQKDKDAINYLLRKKYAEKYDKKRREIRGETTISREKADQFALKAIEEYRAAKWGEADEVGDPDIRDLQQEFASYGFHADSARSYIKSNTELNENDIKFIGECIFRQYELLMLREISVAAGYNPATRAFAQAAATAGVIIETPDEWKIKSRKPTENGGMDNLGKAKVKLTLFDACEMLKNTKWWINLPSKTKANYEPSYELMLGLLGKDKEVHTISPDEVIWLHMMYDNIPMYLSRAGDIKKAIETNMRLHDKRAINAKEVISSQTKMKLRTVPIKLFSELKRRLYILENFMEENFPAWECSPKKTRVQYSDDDLQNIFNIISKEEEPSEMFWIPLIAMHTGARRNELCQLTPDDIIDFKGVLSFRIADNEIAKQVMKTAASVRIVPIHSNLINAGFLQYLEKNKKNKNGRIWGGLSLNANGWGDSFGKKYARMVDGMIEKEVGKEKVFHSFRHTVKAKLEENFVNPAHIDAILGWSSSERSVFEKVVSRKKQTSDGYGTGHPIESLKTAIEQIKYEWLKF